jgi:Fe-S cluster biogenesis protein NfuA
LAIPRDRRKRPRLLLDGHGRSYHLYLNLDLTRIARFAPREELAMFIQTEETPNPATLKFLPGRAVLPGEPRDFRSHEDAVVSPLAERIFSVEGVSGVFLGQDFVTVTKQGSDWPHLKPAVLGAIMEHYLSGAPVLADDAVEDADDGNYDAADEETVATIKELIETRVRPAVANDGGDITFQGFRKGVVYLHMRGACSGCPSSTATLKQGIENLLKHFVPDVMEVRPV